MTSLQAGVLLPPGGFALQDGGDGARRQPMRGEDSTDSRGHAPPRSSTNDRPELDGSD